MNWVSLHIFFTSSRGTLLKECVIPLVEELYDKKYIQSHFYIIYPERGPHIRLRLRSERKTDFIYNYVRDRLKVHFAKYPSPADPTRSKDFYPNDSVQLITYEPEYERYGGEKGIEIAEKEFRYSTDAVWYYTKLNPAINDNYSSLMNLAIKLHLVSAYMHCNASLEHAIMFFQVIFNNATSSADLPLIRFNPAIEKPFSDSYSQQKKVLIPYVSAIWNSFSNNQAIDDNIELWKEHEREICSLLQTAYDKAYESDTFKVPYLYDNFPTWSILQSYIHMTNNRIGIIHTDEALIAYLLMRSLKEM